MNVKKYERIETCEAVLITEENISSVVKWVPGGIDPSMGWIKYRMRHTTGGYAGIGDYMLKVTDDKGGYFMHCTPEEFHKLWKEVQE